MPITSTGVWSEEEAQHHQHSNKLAQFLIGYLPKDKPVYDFGAGLGYYVNELNKAGFNAWAFDGNDSENKLTDKFIVHDLTGEMNCVHKGSVICLEVLEHVPQQYEQQLLDNIVDGCDTHLILSWALTGQAGIGHVNCVEQSYAIAEIERRGFRFCKGVTANVRHNIEDNVSWFRNTLLIFQRI